MFRPLPRVMSWGCFEVSASHFSVSKMNETFEKMRGRLALVAPRLSECLDSMRLRVRNCGLAFRVSVLGLLHTRLLRGLGSFFQSCSGFRVWSFFKCRAGLRTKNTSGKNDALSRQNPKAPPYVGLKLNEVIPEKLIFQLLKETFSVSAAPPYVGPKPKKMTPDNLIFYRYHNSADIRECTGLRVVSGF
jgi:hypothetical protein